VRAVGRPATPISRQAKDKIMSESVIIDIYTVTYAPWEEGTDEPEKIGEDHDTAIVERDPAAIAEWLRNAGTSEASDYPASCADAHTWYSAETYEHPYTGEREEKTFHPKGLTNAEARQVAELL
jgi:hypothetical protein